MRSSSLLRKIRLWISFGPGVGYGISAMAGKIIGATQFDRTGGLR